MRLRSVTPRRVRGVKRCGAVPDLKDSDANQRRWLNREGGAWRARFQTSPQERQRQYGAASVTLLAVVRSLPPHAGQRVARGAGCSAFDCDIHGSSAGAIDDTG